MTKTKQLQKKLVHVEAELHHLRQLTGGSSASYRLTKSLTERNDKLVAENASLKEQITAATAQIQVLLNSQQNADDKLKNPFILERTYDDLINQLEAADDNEEGASEIIKAQQRQLKASISQLQATVNKLESSKIFRAGSQEQGHTSKCRKSCCER